GEGGKEQGAALFPAEAFGRLRQPCWHYPLPPRGAEAVDRRFRRGMPSFITGSGSWSCSRQYASCEMMSGCEFHFRCHDAKSAYWIESGESGVGWPAEKASYTAVSSSISTPSDQPSQTTWCMVMS